MGWVVNATFRPLYPRKRPGTHCIGGWVGLNGCGKSRPHRDSIPRTKNNITEGHMEKRLQFRGGTVF